MDIQERAINTLRFLSADAVQQANSGHPGMPMGAAAMAYTLWTKHLRHNPQNPGWPNRDRFILSGGHGSMLLYALLHLTGYSLSLEEIKNFRQFGSLTPGHPEYGLTPGVEVTTGPLGQGFANGVGMAIAEAHLSAVFNAPQRKLVNHFTYAIVTDGDLMEGVSAEAASLAGHLQLGKLIYFYDDNHISIDGSTDLTFTEDRAARFKAYGWHTQIVDDGNDVNAIDKAITTAKSDQRPSLILCRTIIGFGSPNRQGKSKAHGEPLGKEELDAAKENLGWPLEPRFYIPEDVAAHFREALERGEKWENDWLAMLKSFRAADKSSAAEFERRISNTLPADWDADLPVFPADEKGMATRAASGKALNALAARLPELAGGSADLAPSNNTTLIGLPAFQKDSPEGRNFHFGVRENAMGSIVNGKAVHGGMRSFGATFLVFADYMRPAIRLSALSHLPSIWVFTHDSIGVGEDGPTHQPVEHLASLRAIPNLVTIRPGDANEAAQAWRVALARQNGPTALIFTRQPMPTLDRNIFAPAEDLQRGAYVLADLGEGKPEILLMASGSEVELIVSAGLRLASEGVNVRLVSFPSWELFSVQEKSYRDSVLLPEVIKRIAVEAAIAQGWERWIGDQGAFIGMTGFGASAPAPELFEHFGITSAAIFTKAQEMLRS